MNCLTRLATTRRVVAHLGQSNAGGHRDESMANEWPALSRGVQPGVLYSHRVETGARYAIDEPWHPMIPSGVSNTAGGPREWTRRGSMALDLGRRLADLGHHPAIAHYAMGATGSDWWVANLATVKSWLAARLADLSGATLEVCVVAQGENDAVGGPSPSNWGANWAIVIADLRATFNPDLAFVFVRLPASWSAPYLIDVWADQDALAASDPLVTLIRYDTATFVDGTHWDPESTTQFAVRAAAETDRFLRAA